MERIGRLRATLLRGLAFAWGIALLVGGGGVVLGVDDAAVLLIAMPPATLVVVWIWRRLGVALEARPATF